jgi:flagellar hook-associated protein 1
MDSMSIAIGALNAAKLGLDVAGNNISNAATEGYHRQRLELTPAYASDAVGFMLGGGVDVAEIGRLLDTVLEKQITAQTSLAGQANTELDTLSSVEAAFNELGGEGSFNAAMDSFFNSFQKLGADPASGIMQTEVLNTAGSMVEQFHTLGDFLTDLSKSIVDKAQTTVGQINELAAQIANLNGLVRDNTLKGATTNNLRDQRDARLNELAKLVGIDTIERSDGVVDINIAGSWLVVDVNVQKIQVTPQQDGKLALSPEGSINYTTELEGGQLGAYLTLNNTSVASVSGKLDTLAKAVIDEVNRFHVQGTGAGGSFTELLGSPTASETLSDWDPPVEEGDVYIRVTDTATGTVTRTKVHVDPSSDTLTSIAEKLDTVNGITAQVQSGRLSILASSGYTFDFTPAMGTPSADSITGTLVPSSVSGVYAGTANNTWTFTVVGAGAVGSSSPLTLKVTDSSGKTVVPDLNVGAGYSAGQPIAVADGVEITIPGGTLVDGDSFSLDVVSNTDTSGFLAASGLNTFFSGRTARDISLSDHVANSPSNIASSSGKSKTDGMNAKLMSRLNDAASSDLDNTSISGYYQQMVTDIGRDVALKDVRAKNIDAVTQNLKTQREERSGVDINDEAAQMLIFEQMFQASARYLTTVQSTMDEIMKLL